MENVEIEKIPVEVVDSYDEQSIYFASPPLTLEIQEINKKLILTKLDDDSINIPIGSTLTLCNQKKITSKNAADILTEIKKWNKSSFSSDSNHSTSLTLKFKIDVEDHDDQELYLSTIHPTKSRFIQELNQKVRTKFHLELNDEFLLKWCGIYGWDEITLVSLINHVLEEAKQKLKNPPEVRRHQSNEESYRDSDSRRSHESETSAGLERDLLDNVPTNHDNHPNEYFVSLQSRQLGMTVENVLERTIVRSVYPNSEAFRLNVRPNSLILSIGASSTKDQTHLETLEALKNTVRPVRLRLYYLNEKVVPELSKFRGEMQLLVQRQKFNSQETSSILAMVERKLLWVFEIYSFLECIAGGKLMEKHNQLMAATVENETDEQKSLRIEEAEFCRFNANLCIIRAIKVLEAFELTRQSFLENERREALIHMRCSAISEAMCDIRELFSWSSSSGFPHKTSGAKQEFKYLSMVIGVLPIDLFHETIRNLCYTVFLITNDQQPDLQQTFPDRATCDVLDIVIGNTLTKKILREQHIPALWKLAGSSSVQARIACANLVPLVYIHLSSLQRLRIRGLVNRLMVDSISAVRSYVLSSVCIRILKSVVTHHNGLSLGTEEEESVTLNWIAHCMIQGSNDNDAEVRKSALQICRILVEYSALGSEMNNAENQSLIKELYSYLPDTAPPVTTFSYDSLSSSSSGNTEEGSPGGGDSRGREGDVIIPSMADVHIMFCRALPIISRLVEDKEVQIRSFVGSYCGEFCILMGGKWSMILLDVIFTCCRDPVMEVRVAGLTGMPHVIIAFLQDAILKLRHDSSCAIPPPAPPSSPSSTGTGTAPTVFRPLISVISALCSMYRDNNSEVKRSLCRILSKTLSLFFSINSNNITTSPHLVSSSTNSNNHTTHTNTHTSPPTPTTDATLASLESSLSLTIIHLLTDPDPLILIEMMTQFELSLASEYLTGESSYVSLIFLPDHSRTLFNCLQVLSRNSNWRVRKLICALIPKFVLTLGSFDFPLTSSKPHPSSSSSTSLTSTSFLEMVGKLIHDPVFDVRKAATRSLCLSALNLSMERSSYEMSQNWLDGVILPQLESLRLSRRYSERILGLHMISILLLEEVIHEEDVRYNILIQIALALARDPVANVRIALCEMLWNVAPLIRQHTISSVMTPMPPPLPSSTAASAGAPRGKETGLNGKQQSPSEDVKRYANEFNRIQSELLPVVQETLKSLLDDPDKDVCYSASKAMRCLESDGSAESPESNGEGWLPLILRRKQER